MERVCEFLNNLSLDSVQHKNDALLYDDTDDHSEHEQSLYEITDEEENRAVSNKPVRANKVTKKEQQSFSLTFRDVEDSIRHFDGGDDYPVEKWIIDFEEIAEVTGWNELQKLIFAKKSLTGLAKLFVQSVKGIKTWSDLKEKLTSEFEL